MSNFEQEQDLIGFLKNLSDEIFLNTGLRRIGVYFLFFFYLSYTLMCLFPSTYFLSKRLFCLETPSSKENKLILLMGEIVLASVCLGMKWHSL